MVTSFGEYIKQRRTELGFPMRKVASHLDIDTSTYGKIEREERNLSSELMPNLAKILETEYEELLNHYYSTKVIQELKDYPNYKDVLNIVNEKLELYVSNQIRLSFKKKWYEKEFEKPNSTTRVATLFSGIGAIEYGFKRLNLDTEIIFASDIDKFVKESYFANYDIDESRWYDDVKEINGKKYKGQIDILVGGSPCQSFSMVGKRKGLKDTRGTLFYEFARIVKESQPKVFIFENVKGLINHDKGNTFDTIKATFPVVFIWILMWNPPFAIIKKMRY
tara:strand:- start:815 stop:1648 length:834 start_codon:yes stop_codon:yes gene_type:complete